MSHWLLVVAILQMYLRGTKIGSEHDNGYERQAGTTFLKSVLSESKAYDHTIYGNSRNMRDQNLGLNSLDEPQLDWSQAPSRLKS